ncbi:MAG: hypothetical protein JW819_04880 [Candidatus Krumholzibacteriota bacterium]|nr:hypothetical protein [Candidatus Krumholzibacteriota bacterium]
MADETKLDLAAAHKNFSASCFNAVWELLDKADRTEREGQRMIELAHASIWHWTQREDCTDTNMSIGYWQASRVYATLGMADEARRYGTLCLAASAAEGVPPFYLGYAHEALSRAAGVAGDREEAAAQLAEARRIAETVPDEEAKKMLLADLDTLG